MRNMSVTVVVIGGGATGVGILRDLSMRGARAVLLEQGGLAHGTLPKIGRASCRERV